jgi:hypothetical protein
MKMGRRLPDHLAIQIDSLGAKSGAGSDHLADGPFSSQQNACYFGDGTSVSSPRNNMYSAGDQLAVFQGASEAPISESYGSSEQRRKTANRPRPGGLR